MKSSIGPLGALIAGAAFLGCAALPPPTARLASTAAAIRAAEELKAVEIAPAQLRLQYARDQYQAGQKLVEAGEHEKADRVLARAEADAELAVAIARQAEGERAALAAQLELQKVSAK